MNDQIHRFLNRVGKAVILQPVLVARQDQVVRCGRWPNLVYHPENGDGSPGRSSWICLPSGGDLGKSVALVIGYWVSGDTLATVNALTVGGVMSLEEAAKQTRTGGYARSWGYTHVETVFAAQSAQGTQGTPGNYSRVYVLFKK